MKKIILTAMILTAIGLTASSQHLSTYKYRVKGIGEFFARFNGDEHTDLLDPTDPDYKRQSIYYVVDHNKAKSKDFTKRVAEFADSVLDNNVRLGFDNAAWWVVANAHISFKESKKEYPIQLSLKLEQYADAQYKWTIFGVNGLKQVGVYNLGQMNAMSPTENELDFIQLESIFKYNAKDISSYRSSDVNYDQLSAFFALTESGAIKWNGVDSIKYHFLQVPGYIFTVEYFQREGSNAGWLISDFQKATLEDKSNFINKLIGHTDENN